MEPPLLPEALSLLLSEVLSLLLLEVLSLLPPRGPFLNMLFMFFAIEFSFLKLIYIISRKEKYIHSLLELIIT